MYSVEESLSDADLLRAIAIDVTHNEVRENYNISKDVALTIYSEAKYQLNLMGEDTSEVVDAYNFE
jgi:aromatic ring-opening dioxygenase LigB subunit